MPCIALHHVSKRYDPGAAPAVSDLDLEIQDGEFTGRIVSPCVMSGHVIDLLNSITAVSTDFNVIGSGSCGKGYKEWVRVSDGGACLKAKVKLG